MSSDQQLPFSETPPERNHKLLLGVAGLLVLLVVVALLLLSTFRSEEKSALEITRDRVTSRAQALDARLGELSYQVSSMRRWAEEALNGPSPLPKHPLLSEIHDIPGSGAYGLESASGTLARNLVGNIFGRGNVAQISASLWREINLALWLFPQHRAALASSEELARVYYDSFDHMYAISPWVSHKEMLYQAGASDMPTLIEHARRMDFIQLGLPERNPSRQAYWTPLYEDPSGKGPMITHAAPVYEGSNARGIVGIDISLHFLAYYVRRSGSDGGRYFIVGTAPEEKSEQLVIGQSGQVAASTDPIAPGSVAGDFDSVAKPEGWSWSDVSTLAAGSVGRLGNDYVIAVPLTKAPWMLLYVLPESSVESAAFRTLRPTLTIILILLTILGGCLWALRQQRRHLRTLATQDVLTGALNRREFLAALQREWSRQRRQQNELSLLIIDVDHFKQINDTHGPVGGDQILHTLSRVTSGCLRAGDLFGRIGGKEFAVVLPDANAGRGEQVAERLRATIASQPARVSGTDIRFTVSIGVAWARAEDRDWSELVLRSEQALRAAKRRGRNRVARYNPSAMPPLSTAPVTEWHH